MGRWRDARRERQMAGDTRTTKRATVTNVWIGVLVFLVAAATLGVSIAALVTARSASDESSAAADRTQQILREGQRASTEVVRYEVPSGPYNSIGSTRCFRAGSLTTGRLDAARCIDSDSIVRDPCFYPSSRDADRIQVYCPSVLDSTGVALDVESNDEIVEGEFNPVPRPFSQSDAVPWAVILSNGMGCVAEGGATFVIRDVRVNYTCGNPRAANAGSGYIRGRPDTRGREWFAMFSRTPTPGTFHVVKVRKAWI